MPLLDHFNPPLYPARHWESFHARWTGAIADSLNEKLLPRGYFAEMQVHVGSRVEVDFGSFQDDAQSTGSRAMSDQSGGVATLMAPVWVPPAPMHSMPSIFPDSIEALVYNSESGATLVAAVELVSPGNKDRPEARRGFAAKCATYLQQGVGLIIVDVVTIRSGNLHNELVELLGVGDRFEMAGNGLYATAYRPIRKANDERIDLWQSELAVGRPLALLPLALDKGICLPLDLEAPYMEACQRSRLNV